MGQSDRLETIRIDDSSSVEQTIIVMRLTLGDAC